jgi:hypothetical protein
MVYYGNYELGNYDEVGVFLQNKMKHWRWKCTLINKPSHKFKPLVERAEKFRNT